MSGTTPSQAPATPQDPNNTTNWMLSQGYTQEQINAYYQAYAQQQQYYSAYYAQMQQQNPYFNQFPGYNNQFYYNPYMVRHNN